MDSDAYITARNSLANMKSILEDLSSEEYASRLSVGPINGFINLYETYEMFIDFYLIFQHEEVQHRVGMTAEDWAALTTVKDSLDRSMEEKYHDEKRDAEVLASPNWQVVERDAAVALRHFSKLEASPG
jgi:hypothetical protein